MPGVFISKDKKLLLKLNASYSFYVLIQGSTSSLLKKNILKVSNYSQVSKLLKSRCLM